jgi:hypothetical protein
MLFPFEYINKKSGMLKKAANLGKDKSMAA